MAVVIPNRNSKVVDPFTATNVNCLHQFYAMNSWMSSWDCNTKSILCFREGLTRWKER
ncbi:unnamed protein product, partial [Musa textilis]